MKSDYGLFENCWIELHGKDGTHEGKIILQFHLDTDFLPFYIIKVVDPSHKTLEVRDATLMSPDASLPPVRLANAVTLWDKNPSKFYNGLQ